MEKTLGGDRLGAGKKMKVDISGYERSTHDLSYIFRNTNSAGTLVPFMSMVALPGDSFDIDLDCEVRTHPTIGPLFGSYKVQMDVFSVPMRLYNAKLHMNLLGIGMDMKQIKLPQLRLKGFQLDFKKDLDNQQVNPSCIFNYLGIRGIGQNETGKHVYRDFNAIPWLAYWDIYKQYYANKQEEIGAVIHNDLTPVSAVVEEFAMYGVNNEVIVIPADSGPLQNLNVDANSKCEITFDPYEEFDIKRFTINSVTGNYNITELFENWVWIPSEFKVVGTGIREDVIGQEIRIGYYILNTSIQDAIEPKVVTFPLENIDTMRKDILSSVNISAPFLINVEQGENTYNAPYGLALKNAEDGFGEVIAYSATSNQEGLALKTYQSDMYNNWLSNEWVAGSNGINEITAIEVHDNKIYIDEINMMNKVYNMLNKIAVSGGTADDWQEVNWGIKRNGSVENPIYLGGLIKELVFQEVVSNAGTSEQPLGTLAGRGALTGKHKGGKINVRVEEPSYLIGIYSLTPRLDYSQGNEWDVNLKNIDELHKPSLDEVGFEDLLTDGMAFWDTRIDLDTIGFNSVGKQPAWLKYMTNTNKVKGNFAVKNDQMWMTLNRRYEVEYFGASVRIKDMTTYIDPKKFNHIFADTRLDSQNFWTQIAVDITARRKMSAKVMPNL